MTREEAIQELAKWAKQMKDHGVPNYSARYTALGMAIEALQAEPKTKCVARIEIDTEEIVRRIKEEYDITDGWIPINERLPKVGEVCLLTVHEYGWNCKEYTRVVIGEYSDNYAGHILAWMPLPKPYREDDE